MEDIGAEIFLIMEKLFDTVIAPFDFEADDLQWMSAMWANVEIPQDEKDQVTFISFISNNIYLNTFEVIHLLKPYFSLNVDLAKCFKREQIQSRVKSYLKN